MTQEINSYKAHGYHQWFSYVYLDGTKEAAEAFRLVMDILKKNENHKKFITDLSKNISGIMDTLDDKEYYANCPTKIELQSYQRAFTYSEYIGYRKNKIVNSTKIAPTFAAIEKKPVTAMMENAKLTYFIGEGDDKKVVDMEQMKQKVGTYMEAKGENCDFRDDPVKLLVTDFSKARYEEIDTKRLNEITVENKATVGDLVEFCRDIMIHLKNPKYKEYMMRALQSNQNEIPIMRKKGDSYVPQYLVLPQLLKNFLRKDHSLLKQDISDAMLKRFGIDATGKSSAQIKKETLDALKEWTANHRDKLLKKEEDNDNDGATLLYNISWLTDENFNDVKRYLPIYTGAKISAWCVQDDKGYAGTTSVAELKQIYMLVTKIARFFGLWMRAGLHASKIFVYLQQVLGLNPARIYGYVITKNIEFWISQFGIDVLLETPMSNVGIASDAFVTKDVDLDELLKGDSLFDVAIKQIPDVVYVPRSSPLVEEKVKEKEKDKKKKKKKKISESSEDSSSSEQKKKSKKRSKEAKKKKAKKRDKSQSDETSQSSEEKKEDSDSDETSLSSDNDVLEKSERKKVSVSGLTEKNMFVK